MFCPKCGNQVPDEARFCPKCGNRFERARATAASEHSGESHAPSSMFSAGSAGSFFSNPARALCVADVALLLMTFLPWVTINVYIYSQQFSLLDLATQASRINDLASNYLGSSYATSDASSSLAGFAVMLMVAWLAMVATLAVDAVKRFKDGRGMSGAFIISAIVALLAICASMGVDADISKNMGSYMGSQAISGVIAPTIWPWVVLVAAIVCGVFHGKTCKK